MKKSKDINEQLQFHFIEKTKVFLIKNIISRMEDIEFEEISNQYVIEVKKMEVKK